MPFAQINNYLAGQFIVDVANYLNGKRANFRNVANYCNPNTLYFTEGTVKGVMFACISNWLVANEVAADVLVVSEVRYPGFNNWADLAVVYDNGNGPSITYIEVKADFNPHSINLDIALLDDVSGVMNSPLDQGYAFYMVKNNNQGWVNNVDAPLAADVAAVAIVVNP